jgi:hypothetical protein
LKLAGDHGLRIAVGPKIMRALRKDIEMRGVGYCKGVSSRCFVLLLLAC